MGEVCTWPGWKCVRLLGEGSFGKVYEIEHTDYGQTYKAALKVISIPSKEINAESIFLTRQSGMNTESFYEEYIADIMKEIAVMSQFVGNTNVVSYQDHTVLHEEGSMHWDILLRMELLTSLTDYVNRYGFDEDRLVQMGIDLCRALELCEKHGIIHRDIKLANIFVSDSGAFKLGDFGVARSMKNMEASMSRKGTLSYMAPEVYYGGTYGHQADIYSLGLVMYTVLNHWRHPFLPEGEYRNSDRVNAAMMRLSNSQIPLPVTGHPELQGIVMKAMAYNPSDRYLHASQMRAALEVYQSRKRRGQLGVYRQREKKSETRQLRADATVLFTDKTKKNTGGLVTQYLSHNRVGRWHFVVSNIVLSLSAVFCVFNAVCYLSGAAWSLHGLSARDLYTGFPFIQYCSIAAGIVYSACALLAILVWKGLRNYRYGAVWGMLLFFILLFVIDLLLYLTIGYIVGISLIEPLYAVPAFIIDTVFCVINGFYYHKNRQRFLPGTGLT